MPSLPELQGMGLSWERARANKFSGLVVSETLGKSSSASRKYMSALNQLQRCAWLQTRQVCDHVACCCCPHSRQTAWPGSLFVLLFQAEACAGCALPNTHSTSERVEGVYHIPSVWKCGGKDARWTPLHIHLLKVEVFTT
eukprot:365468-Chlamydomonas_euryale.AAC.8